MANIFGIKRLLAPWAKLNALKSAPKGGYNVYQLTSGAELDDFLVENAKIVSVVVIHDPASKHFEAFQKYLAVTPLGHPLHVNIGYLPIANTPRAVVEGQRILSLPTSLVVFDRKVLAKTVGVRTNELSVKCKIALRNAGLNPCSQ